MRKKILFLVIGFSAIVTTYNAHAGGWAGGGGDSSFGGGGTSENCSDSAGRIDCGISWLKYEYAGGSEFQGQDYYFNPNGNDTGDGKLIAGDCASSGVGFYHLGIIAKPTREFIKYSFGDYSNFGNKTYKNSQNYWNSVGTAHVFDGTYADGGSYSGNTSYIYTYRFNNKKLGHRFSLSPKTAGDYYSGTNPSFTDSGQYSHILYKNAKVMYESVGSATSKTNIAKAYAAYLNNKYSSGTGVPDNQYKTGGTAVCSYTDGHWDCGSVPEDIYAFCAFPESNPTTLSPKATLTISGHPKSSKSTTYTFSATKTTDTAEDSYIYEVHTSTISVKGDFNFKIDKAINTADFTPTLSVGGQAITASSLSFSGTTAEIGDSLFDSVKTKIVTLAENVDEKICAIATTPSTIDANSTSGNNRTAEACLHVKYVPIIAYVHSNTIAQIDNKMLIDPSKTTFVSGKDSSLSSDTIYVKPGPFDISWGHYIGYGNVSPSGSTVSEVWTHTRNIWGGGDLKNQLKIGAYSNPGNSFSSYSWSRLNENDIGAGSLDYPSSSASHRVNKTTEGYFPGEDSSSDTKNKQVLKHPKKVYANVQSNSMSGGNKVGDEEISSSVELNFKAKDLQCGLKKDEYNLTDDYLYPIGVENAQDYRWLGMMRTRTTDTTRLVVVGDGLADSANMWFKENDQVTIIQRACFGSQIAVDASNGGEDRFSRNLWMSGTTDNRETDTYHNRQFTLSTGFSDDFFKNGNGTASKMGSHTDQSLRASEIGISDFSKSSTPDSRIQANYMGNAMTTPKTIGNLGTSISTSFAKPNGESVSITAKVPYNYYLTIAPGNTETLEGTESTNFEVTIKNNGRINQQVCSGTDNGDNGKSCASYPTDTKSTTANMVVFALDASFDVDALNAKDDLGNDNHDFTVSGNVATADGIEAVVENRLGAYNPERIKEAEGSFSGDVISKNGQKTLNANNVKYGSYPVGTKICAATAVFPSDSHDTGIDNRQDGAYVVDDDRQWEALRTEGELTRFNITCRTIAKHQTMSVEGNGVLTSGAIKSSKVIYEEGGQKREFRSWSEYQIIANGSNASSGAVTAYGLGADLSVPNKAQSATDASVSKGKMLYLQTLGNYDMPYIYGEEPKPTAQQESEIGWEYAERLMRNIIDKYGTKDGECKNGNISSENHNILFCQSGGFDLMPKDYEDKDTIVVRSSDGTINITNDSHLGDDYQDYWGGKKQIIVIAKNIAINPDVEKINAWLIVDGGTFNTCGNNNTGYRDLNNRYDGNQHLLDNCNQPLIINGPVIVKGTITLPRTFGGGSEKIGNGIIARPESYVQRAEIFNFDPSIVEWAYKESEREPQIKTTYVESLAPRL